MTAQEHWGSHNGRLGYSRNWCLRVSGIRTNHVMHTTRLTTMVAIYMVGTASTWKILRIQNCGIFLIWKMYALPFREISIHHYWNKKSLFSKGVNAQRFEKLGCPEQLTPWGLRLTVIFTFYFNSCKGLGLLKPAYHTTLLDVNRS